MDIEIVPTRHSFVASLFFWQFKLLNRVFHARAATTKRRYIGCKQRLREAVNDAIGTETGP